MKEFSKELIEIGGKEYTLFLNRNGIVAWEKATKFSQKVSEIRNKYSNLIERVEIEEEIEIKDGDNPLDIIKGSQEEKLIEEAKRDKEIVTNSYITLYWIMLYENHKLNISEVRDLYKIAIEEYGEEPLMELGNQMIEDANRDRVGTEQLKKLSALRPKTK